MRELRAQSGSQPLRVFYAFDPRRSATLLIGGNKTEYERFYETWVSIGDDLYDAHLTETYALKITKRDHDWLEHFASGGRERPRGMGPGGVSNFVSRKWIVRLERDMDFGPELYRLTPEGLAALERIRGNGGYAMRQAAKLALGRSAARVGNPCFAHRALTTVG